MRVKCRKWVSPYWSSFWRSNVDEDYNSRHARLVSSLKRVLWEVLVAVAATHSKRRWKILDNLRCAEIANVKYRNQLQLFSDFFTEGRICTICWRKCRPSRLFSLLTSHDNLLLSSPWQQGKSRFWLSTPLEKYVRIVMIVCSRVGIEVELIK